MTINLTDDLAPATFDPNADTRYDPAADVTDRFRALRSEVNGDMERALNLLDVARLRNATYRNTLDVARQSADTLAARVNELEALVADLNATITRQQEAARQPIALDDPRLEAEWKRAGAIATEEGFCSEYDRMCERLGIPGRSRTFYVDVDVTLSRSIQVEVTATSVSDAEESIDDDEILSALGLSRWDYNVEDFTVGDVSQ